MEKGDVNGALKLLTNNMSNGNLPLNENYSLWITFQFLHEKHLASKNADDEVHMPEEKTTCTSSDI